MATPEEIKQRELLELQELEELEELEQLEAQELQGGSDEPSEVIKEPEAPAEKKNFFERAGIGISDIFLGRWIPKAAAEISGLKDDELGPMENALLQFQQGFMLEHADDLSQEMYGEDFDPELFNEGEEKYPISSFVANTAGLIFSPMPGSKTKATTRLGNLALQSGRFGTTSAIFGAGAEEGDIVDKAKAAGKHFIGGALLGSFMPSMLKSAKGVDVTPMTQRVVKKVQGKFGEEAASKTASVLHNSVVKKSLELTADAGVLTLGLGAVGTAMGYGDPDDEDLELHERFMNNVGDVAELAVPLLVTRDFLKWGNSKLIKNKVAAGKMKITSEQNRLNLEKTAKKQALEEAKKLREGVIAKAKRDIATTQRAIVGRGKAIKDTNQQVSNFTSEQIRLKKIADENLPQARQAVAELELTIPEFLNKHSDKLHMRQKSLLRNDVFVDISDTISKTAKQVNRVLHGGNSAKVASRDEALRLLNDMTKVGQQGKQGAELAFEKVPGILSKPGKVKLSMSELNAFKKDLGDKLFNRDWLSGATNARTLEATRAEGETLRQIMTKFNKEITQKLYESDTTGKLKDINKVWSKLLDVKSYAQSHMKSSVYENWAKAKPSVTTLRIQKEFSDLLKFSPKEITDMGLRKQLGGMLNHINGTIVRDTSRLKSFSEAAKELPKVERGLTKAKEKLSRLTGEARRTEQNRLLSQTQTKAQAEASARQLKEVRAPELDLRIADRQAKIDDLIQNLPRNFIEMISFMGIGAFARTLRQALSGFSQDPQIKSLLDLAESRKEVINAKALKAVEKERND